MFPRDRSVLSRNQMKPFYWLEMTWVKKLTNKNGFISFRNNTDPSFANVVLDKNNQDDFWTILPVAKTKLGYQPWIGYLFSLNGFHTHSFSAKPQWQNNVCLINNLTGARSNCSQIKDWFPVKSIFNLNGMIKLIGSYSA